MPKALIFDPYLDTLGGGERYALTVAEILLTEGWQVDLVWSGSPTLLETAAHRFGLNLKGLGTSPDPFILNGNPLNYFKKIIQKPVCDLVFYLSDGSLPWLFCRQSLLHLQVPFTNSFDPLRKTINFLKLLHVKKIICNSHFTENFIKKTYLTNKTTVWYPPVDVSQIAPPKIKATPKKNYILAVGRFDEHTINNKRQDILVKSFIEMLDGGLKNWTLILAGNSLDKPEKNKFLLRLKRVAQGYPIYFKVNCPFDNLVKLYRQSKIFWHAAGYGVDDKKHPELVEHFGMTCVEAMSTGAVPVVVNKGGLKEIVSHGKDGWLWETPQDLINFTNQLINNPPLFKKASHLASQKAKLFSKIHFAKKLKKIIAS